MKRTARTIHRLREQAKTEVLHRYTSGGKTVVVGKSTGKWKGRGTPGAFGRSRVVRALMQEVN